MSDFPSTRAMHIRPVIPADRSRIQQIVAATGNFSDEEIDTAMELIDEALAVGEDSGYIAVVAGITDPAAEVEGYACYGPTPLTEGVFDLYWIAVDPKGQGRGVGRRLLEYVENDIRSRGGRMLLIETSSRDRYAPTVAFYRHTNYELAARIRNFYRIGDDKLIFSKELT
jgi:ribosomal protein S18 acetylase RimI-like enzyme